MNISTAIPRICTGCGSPIFSSNSYHIGNDNLHMNCTIGIFMHPSRGDLNRDMWELMIDMADSQKYIQQGYQHLIERAQTLISKRNHS